LTVKEEQGYKLEDTLGLLSRCDLRVDTHEGGMSRHREMEKTGQLRRKKGPLQMIQDREHCKNDKAESQEKEI
jgi:hypothetical protein